MPSLMPTGKQQYFYPGSTSPLAGGQLFTYAAGTSTQKATYQDAAGTIANPNPIPLDSTGSALVFWSGSYKVVLKDSAGNTVYTVDNYTSPDKLISDTIATFQLADYAALRAFTGTQQTVYLTGYLASAAPQGIAGQFVRDDTDTTSTDNGGTIIVAANGKRWKRALSGEVNVVWFGAKGDGVTDDSAAITAADQAAKLLGKALTFPVGTYMAYGLKPTAPWLSRDGATIKNNQPAADYSSFVRATSASGITSWECENITFDGSASADPAGGWTSANYDSFTGSFGLFLLNLTSFSLRRVKAQNAANGAGIRIAGCSNGVLDRCEAKRSRGKYGDGIYIDSSSYIKVISPRCSDFTRIGVVTENGCYEIDISDAVCRDGHDASIKYGSTEYNAGFWNENTGSVRLIRCTSINSLGANTNYRHFVNATGSVPNFPGSRAMHSQVQCNAYGYAGEIGFIAYSLGTLPLLMRREECTSDGCDSPFVDNAYLDTDSFINAKCHAAYPLAASGMQSGFQWGSQNSFTRYPLFEYESCTVSYTAMPAGAQAALDNGASNTGDFTCFAGGMARVRVVNCHNLDSTLPVYIKQGTGSLDLLVENSFVAPLISNAVNKVRFKNVQVTGSNGSLYYVNGSADFESVGSSFMQRIQLGVTGNILLEGGQVKMPNDSYLLIQRTLNSAKPALHINNVRFEKDIAAGDYVLRIQEQGATKPGTVITGATFYNSGAPTSANSFIWFVSPLTALGLSATVSDASVTNLYKTNTTLQPNPTGNTQIAMH